MHIIRYYPATGIYVIPAVGEHLQYDSAVMVAKVATKFTEAMKFAQSMRCNK